jgi:hypothetical protein
MMRSSGENRKTSVAKKCGTKNSCLSESIVVIRSIMKLALASGIAIGNGANSVVDFEGLTASTDVVHCGAMYYCSPGKPEMLNFEIHRATDSISRQACSDDHCIGIFPEWESWVRRSGDSDVVLVEGSTIGGSIFGLSPGGFLFAYALAWVVLA